MRAPGKRRVKKFHDDWQQATGAPASAPLALNVETVTALLQAGWAESDADRIADYARHVLTARGMVFQTVDETFDQPDWTDGALAIPAVAFELGGALHMLLDNGPTLAEAFDWLAVIIAKPANADARYDLARMLGPTQGFTDPSDISTWGETRPPVVTWAGILPDRRAPLAYAAGLTPEEAAAQYADGTLAPDTLRALAALRGWRLPARLLT